jgi:hypothetical protein
MNNGRKALSKTTITLSAAICSPFQDQPQPSIIASPMFIRQFTTWSPAPFMTPVRLLVVRLAVAIARGLALVHQIAGDEPYAE